MANVASNNAPSASTMTILAHINENVVAVIPAKSLSTPIAAFQSMSTRVRRDASRSEQRAWVAHNMARIITDCGADGRPLAFAYMAA